MSVPGTALILAAGFGTRLRPITDHAPKALVDVGGRPMIEYPIRMLAAAGVTRFVINLHHLGERIREALGDGRALGVAIAYSAEDPILDTGGAIRRARPLLGGGDFLVANCDALMDLDVRALAALHRREGALATLAVRRDPDAHRYGAVELDPAGRIRRFLGTPEVVEGPLETFMFCGVHALSPAIFDWMPAREIFGITRDVYPRALAAGEKLLGWRHDGYWRDLGTPEELAAARSDLTESRFLPPFVVKNERGFERDRDGPNDRS